MQEKLCKLPGRYAKLAEMSLDRVKKQPKVRACVHVPYIYLALAQHHMYACTVPRCHHFTPTDSVLNPFIK